MENRVSTGSTTGSRQARPRGLVTLLTRESVRSADDQDDPVPPAAERAQHAGRCTRTGRASCRRCATRHAPKHEYFAVRNSVGVFDTSPLFKYRADRSGRGAAPRRGAGARHPHLPAGAGAVHGVVRRPRLRHGGRRRLPARRGRLPAHRRARPTLAGSSSTADGCASRSRTSPTTTACSPSRDRARAAVLEPLMPEVASLAYFEHTQAKIGRHRGHRVPHRLHR